ncbi:hypothetical protein SAMN05216548_12714 [Faunimonas pinastri]|uniref:Helix-turn-helix domain-containing protein n=1 Tax=Faunimonas pinastri TaxID=1855383 RepID=A0A1H9QDA0_9HYPH|nr:hypothetical protein [Faunimonas pinastri]SER58417.1 hypothetical protein SAMN05216548_12714 [Faunimonas pinastri]
MIRTKVDQKGRDTNVVIGRARKALGLPKGVGWSVPVPGALLDSPAWLVLSHRAFKVLGAIMAEHARTGGKENGALVVPYSDIEARGLRRPSISEAIAELQALGLVAVTDRGGRSYGSLRRPSTYRLTWLGTPDALGPTNEWLGSKTEDEARARVERATAVKRATGKQAPSASRRDAAEKPSLPRSNRAVTPA